MAEKASELKRGTLEMVLLKLISEKQMYGYELISSLEARGGELFQLKEGTLYPVLYRLEKAALGNCRARRAAQILPVDPFRRPAARNTGRRVAGIYPIGQPAIG